MANVWDSLKDLVERTEINKLVTDLVNLDRVRSLLTTITCRRRFLAQLQAKRMSMFESHGSFTFSARRVYLILI